MNIYIRTLRREKIHYLTQREQREIEKGKKRKGQANKSNLDIMKDKEQGNWQRHRCKATNYSEGVRHGTFSAT